MNNNIVTVTKNFLSVCEQHEMKIRITSGVLILVGAIWHAVLPPLNFPAGRIVTIENGSTLSEIADMLDDKGIIQSKLLFAASVRAKASDAGVLAGDYFFERPQTVFGLVQRLTTGNFGLEPVRITIHEGLSIYEVADAFEARFEDFDAEHFIELANGKEGYLFPDTYLFLPNVKEDQVIEEMEANFDSKIQSIQDQLIAVGKELDDIIIMASIIEKEAWKENDQKLISGVLWKRLEIGMPLQVDATFAYVNGKNTYELTYDDLEIDSPYNTYKYKGLPVGPIANPGLGAIEAALNPELSDNLFYLADREGNTYYAETFEGHKRNRALYMD